jgi:hypothetical protein
LVAFLIIGDFCKPIFEIHLHFHQTTLKTNQLLAVQQRNVYHPPSQSDAGSCFWHHVNSKPSFTQQFRTVSHCCCLTSTIYFLYSTFFRNIILKFTYSQIWSSCKDNFDSFFLSNNRLIGEYFISVGVFPVILFIVLFLILNFFLFSLLPSIHQVN